MASELRVDTLKDSSGNNSVGMAYVAGGSAKAWYNLNGTGTIASRDDFNIASYTDNGTGDYTSTFTSAMNNANYSIFVGVSVRSGTDANSMPSHYTGTPATTTTYRLHNREISAVRTNRDAEYFTVGFHGDLA